MGRTRALGVVFGLLSACGGGDPKVAYRAGDTDADSDTDTDTDGEECELPGSEHPQVENDPFENVPLCEGSPTCPDPPEEDPGPDPGPDDDDGGPAPPDEESPCGCFYSDGEQWLACPEPSGEETIENVECNPPFVQEEECRFDFDGTKKTCEFDMYTDMACEFGEMTVWARGHECDPPENGGCTDVGEITVETQEAVACEECQTLRERWNDMWRWEMGCETTYGDVSVTGTGTCEYIPEQEFDAQDGYEITADCFHTPPPAEGGTGGDSPDDDSGPEPDAGGGGGEENVCQGTCHYAEIPVKPADHTLLQALCPPEILATLDPCAVTITYIADCREEAPTVEEALPEENFPMIEGLPAGCGV